MVNPTIVIEILSKSTKLKDRNEKFESYILLESLTDYILIEQDAMRIEHFSRINDKDWKVRMYSEADEEIIFQSIECKLPMANIYAKG